MQTMKKVQQGFTLIELMIVVAIIGILAAIAIPAYQDYIARSQMSEAMTLASGLKTSMTECYANNGTFPNNQECGVPAAVSITGKYVSSIRASNAGTITATMKTAGSVSGGIVQASLTLTADTTSGGSITWLCTSSAETKYLPSSCR